MSTSYSPKIVTNGLVCYLDASNLKSYSRSGTTWYDLSGNQNHASIIGSPSFLQNNLGYFSLNGSGQYFNVNNSVSLQNQEFTYCIICNYQNVNTALGIMGIDSDYYVVGNFNSGFKFIKNRKACGVNGASDVATAFRNETNK